MSDRIAIYYRVSTDKQDFDSQRVAVEQWMAGLKEQPKKILIFKDEGISGKHENRPAFRALMTAAMKHEIDVIVVYRLDRFSRNATVAIRTLLELDEHGVGFISVTQPVLNLGHSNPFRRTMLAAFAELAEIERDTIVMRVRSGLEAARKRGATLGAPKKMSEESIRRAHELKAQGLGYRAIAKELNLSTGTLSKLFSANQVARESAD